MGSIDIPPFLRDKMKKDIQDNSNEIDIPDFLKKKDGSDLSGQRPSSYPLANGSNATQSPSSGQSKSSAFDPATFMRQSRAAVLNQPAQDNLSAQAGVPKQIAQQQVQAIQQNTDNSVKAKPVTQQGEIKTDDQPFDLTKSIQTDFPDIYPNEIVGNKDLLSGYYQQKNAMLRNQINQMEASEKRGVMVGEINKLKSEQQALTQQVYHYNSIHAGLEGEGDPVKTGIILGKSMGDPQAVQQERFMAKGIPVNPVQQVNTEKAGLDAQETTLNAKYQGDPQNPEYLNELSNIENQKSTLLQRHPEALRQLWSDKIGEYIAKHLTPLEINLGVYKKTLPEYIDQMKKDGINVPDEVVKNISWPDNLPKDFAGKLLSGFIGTFSNSAASIERMGGNALGIDKDILDQDIQQGQTNLNSSFNLDNPASEELAGKVLPHSSIVAGNVMKGLGALTSFILTANNVGKVAENALGKLAPEMADAASSALSQHIGTDATVFASSYEPNYQKAQQIIGDNPADEGKRNVMATLGSMIDAAVFHLPIGKYGETITEGKQGFFNAVKDLPSDLKGLSSETLNTNLKKYLQKPLANVLEAAGNTIKEAGKFGAMQTAGVLLKHISQSVIADNKESSDDWANVPTEIADEWKTLPISLMPGVFGINLLGAGKESTYRKNAMYDAFNNPQRTLSDLGKAQESGLITPAEYAKRAEVINVGSKILNETPNTNPQTGEPLTHDQSTTWVANRLQEYALEAKKTGIKDDKVLSKFYDGKIKELQAEREQLINPIAEKAPEEKPVEKQSATTEERPAPVSSPVSSGMEDITPKRLNEFTPNEYAKNTIGGDVVKIVGVDGDKVTVIDHLNPSGEKSKNPTEHVLDANKIPDYIPFKSSELTNKVENNSVSQLKEVSGKEVEPHKEVKASKAVAQKEVSEKYGLKPMEASMLHSLAGKDVNQEYEDAEGLKKAMYDKLREKGFIGFNEDGTSYELSEKANDFIKAVDARLDTRKNVKAGTDLFPEDANIPELKSIKKELKNSIDDNTIEHFEQRPAEEVEKSEPTIKDIESKASSDNEADLTEAIRQADELIGKGLTEDKPEPNKGEREVTKTGQLNKDEIGKVAFARSNSYNVFKVIHPEMTVDDYNKLRSSNVEIPNSQLRKLGREYLESHPENEAANTEKFYDEIAGSKPVDTGRIPVSPIIGKPKHLSEILLDVSNSLKQKIFFLKPGRGAAGTYSPGSAAIKIKFTGDLDVTAHEIGHSIDDNFKVLAELRDNPNSDIELELSKFSPFGSKPPKDYPDPELYKRAEGFAEWLRAFIVNPDEAIKQAPKIYELYNSKVSEPYKKALQNFSNDVRTWAGATGRDMVLSNIQWEPEKAKGLIKEIFSRQDNDMFSISWADKLAANWVNPMRAFEKAFQYAKGIKGIDEVLPDKDPAILARLFLSVDRKFGDFLEYGLRNSKDELLKDENGQVKTFKWLIEPLDNTDMATIKKEMEDVTSYMVAERTVELANKFSRASILTGIGGGIYKDADVALKALEEFQEGDPAKLKRIREAAKRYREFSNDILMYMVDKSRLSKEAFNQIKQNNVQYVALHRVMEAEPGTEVQIFSGETRKLSSVNQPVQDIKGSTRKIINPYTALLDSMYKTIKESDRNEVLKAFREMIVSQRGLYEGSTEKLSEVGVIAKPGDKNTIIVFVDGKPEKWALQEDVYKALKGLDNDGFKLPGILTFHAKVLRNMTTKFPTFAIRNWIRDLQDRLIKSNDHSGVRDLFGDKEHWKDVARKGGLNAGYYVRDKAHYYGLMEQAMDEISKNQKTIFADPIKIKKLWHGYENILESAETSNRVAEYRAAFKQAKLKGMDDYNAGLYGAFKSRDLMDFAVAGHYMKMINQMIPFSNAAVQGVRSSVVRAIENPSGFLIRTALYSVLPQVAFWWLNHKDEDTAKEYENLPLYQRDMFFNTKIGANKWLSIPKPYELGMLGSAVDRGLSLAYGYNDNAYSGYAGNVFKAISPVDPSIMGGPMQPIIESMTNYDFFRDKNIITPNENVLNLALRHTETASWLSQQIQKVAGIDARKIDHVIRSQFSYVGNEGLKAIDKTVEFTGGKEPEQRNDFDITDLGLFKRSPAYNSPAVQNMMEFAKEWNLDRSKDYKEFKNLVAKYFDATTDEEKDEYAKQMIDLSNLLMANWKRSGVTDKAKAKFDNKFR